MKHPFLIFGIDNYIVLRYNCVVLRYIGGRYIGGKRMAESIVLTEAVYYILLSLFEPLHGYGIMQKVETLSQGRVRLAAGTLYGAINTLLDKGWIRALPEESNSRKKEYIILDEGKRAVINEINRLRELLDNGERITGGQGK